MARTGKAVIRKCLKKTNKQTVFLLYAIANLMSIECMDFSLNIVLEEKSILSTLHDPHRENTFIQLMKFKVKD